jgi:hypothetical protein
MVNVVSQNLMLILGIESLREPQLDWAGTQCTARLYGYKNSAKPGAILEWVDRGLEPRGLNS